MSLVTERPRTHTHIGEKPLNVPSLPDVRPFGAELMGQTIVLDEDAQIVLTPLPENSELLNNVGAIKKFLTPYFEVTNTSADEALVWLNTLNCASSVKALEETLSSIAHLSLCKVKDVLLASIAEVPAIIQTEVGEVPTPRFENIGIGLHSQDFYNLHDLAEGRAEQCVTIEPIEPVTCFMLYGEKLDGNSRSFLSALAFHIACNSDVTPLPFSFGCNHWIDDYATLTSDQGFQIHEYQSQSAWEDDTFSDWLERVREIIGEQLDGIIEMVSDMHGIRLDDIAFDEDEDDDVGDNLETFRKLASESLFHLALQSSGDYQGEEIDAEFLQNLQDWRNSSQCQHTEVMDKLIAVTKVVLAHLPQGSKGTLESLTEIEDFGIGVLYSLKSIDACKRSRTLIDQHANYQMETGEQCILKADWDDPNWVEKAKSHLVGWWLMSYLETIMESYNANDNGAQTESTEST